MATAAEAAAAATTPMAAVLSAGLDMLSGGQEVTFTQYVRLVLPLDGFVFWVKADQIGQSAVESSAPMASVAFNAPPVVTAPAQVTAVMGSLHYAQEVHQDQDATYTSNRIVLTAKSEIEDLDAIGPTVMFVGEIDGLRFAFQRQGMFYRQTGLWHYEGVAITAPMSTQIIDDATTLNASSVVVSNSLPIWLALNKYMPLFPSYLGPLNEEPPYATVHIEPNYTEALQTVPHLDGQQNQWQLTKDRVVITTYGLRNYTLTDYVQYLYAFSMNTDAFGLLNMPTIRDEKRTQADFDVLAQKKSITLEISYYQQRVRNVAQRLITQALGTVSYGD